MRAGVVRQLSDHTLTRLFPSLVFTFVDAAQVPFEPDISPDEQQPHQGADSGNPADDQWNDPEHVRALLPVVTPSCCTVGL